MTNARLRLGRGLSSLLSDTDSFALRPRDGAEDAAATDETPRVLPIAQIERNPGQPRKRFDETDLAELTASIRARGLLQPILVRPLVGLGDRFQIVAGERRWRAAQAAGLTEIPVVVKSLTDQEVLEISIIENIQRANLNPIEEARGYQALIDQFGHTQDAIAQAVGKSRSHVANTLRLLSLPPRVRDLVYEGKLTAGHARAIATAPEIETLAQRIVAEGLSVRDAEALARGAPAPAPSAAPVPTSADTAPTSPPIVVATPPVAASGSPTAVEAPVRPTPAPVPEPTPGTTPIAAASGPAGEGSDRRAAAAALAAAHGKAIAAALSTRLGLPVDVEEADAGHGEVRIRYRSRAELEALTVRLGV